MLATKIRRDQEALMVITEYVGTWRSSASHVDEETPGRQNNRGVSVVEENPSRALFCRRVVTWTERGDALLTHYTIYAFYLRNMHIHW